MSKQETLEEVAERLFKYYSNNTSLSEGDYDYLMDKEDFTGALIEVAKWQQERMYSEEDMKKAFEDGKEDIDYSEVCGFVSKLTTEEWFKKIKKK